LYYYQVTDANGQTYYSDIFNTYTPANYSAQSETLSSAGPLQWFAGGLPNDYSKDIPFGLPEIPYISIPAFAFYGPASAANITTFKAVCLDVLGNSINETTLNAASITRSGRQYTCTGAALPTPLGANGAFYYLATDGINTYYSSLFLAADKALATGETVTMDCSLPTFGELYTTADRTIQTWSADQINQIN
jgi:hypothetical protein